jgi:hypothetical protein
MSGQFHAPAALSPKEKAPGTHWIGVWVGPRAGLDDVEKRKFLTLPRNELRPLRRPTHNQSLYRLRYPDPLADVRYIYIYIYIHNFYIKIEANEVIENE